MSALLSPFDLAGLRLPNRIVVSPMCQYSAVDGVAQPWHLIHAGSLAHSGAGAMILEATAVEAIGRISFQCLGLYDDAQEAALAQLVAAIRRTSGMPLGIQLAHAGRKASCGSGWDSSGGPIALADGGWTGVAPSALAFGDGWTTPEALDREGMARIVAAFADSAARADRAGFDLIEVHGAHGYLLHSFLSPLSNRRDDDYGGSLDNRMRFPLEVMAALRAAWPAAKPLGIRINGEDRHPEGLSVADMGVFAARLKVIGVDYVTASIGHNLAGQSSLPSSPGYMVHYAQAIREASGIATMAVGMIFDAHQADAIIASGQADLVAIGRAFLDDPHWAIHAATELGGEPRSAPQYRRALKGRWAGYGAAVRQRVPLDQN